MISQALEESEKSSSSSGGGGGGGGGGESEERPSPPSMETAVEIGEGCFVQATVPDASTLLVDTGAKAGVLVEMPLRDALEFVAARAMLLQR